MTGDGKKEMSLADFYRIFKNVLKGKKDEELRRMFNILDTDNSATLSSSELFIKLKVFLDKPPQLDPLNRIHWVFHDTKGHPGMTLQDFLESYLFIYKDLKREEVMKIFGEIDLDQDKVISWRELSNFDKMIKNKRKMTKKPEILPGLTLKME